MNKICLKLKSICFKLRRLKFEARMKVKMFLVKNSKQKIAMWVLSAVAVVIVVGLIFTLVAFAWFGKDLPTPGNVVRREGYSSRIYDRNGEVLYDLYEEEKRFPVTWEEVPEYLKKATIAIEDKSFYQHAGFDPLTPLRMIQNLIFKQRLIGGSTLTQQLVKNVLLTSERKVVRKIREFILAVQIEKKYSKDEILLMYLNEAPYGGTAWGVGPASERYFGKEVSELNLAESVILAGLPQRPSVYSPFSITPKAYVDRSKNVLNRMREDGYISSELEKSTLELIDNYKFTGDRTDIKAPHFVFWIKDILIDRYGEDVVEGGGLQITTSLDLEMQKSAENIVEEEVAKAETLGISNGAAVVVDPRDGQVLAMVGSKDYFSQDIDGKFNVTTQGLRQPGSSIKPITYLAGLKKGYTAASMIIDAPVTFPGVAGQKDYSPQNYTGKYLGPLSLREALGNSINTTAVKMLARVGVKDMLQLAYDMGLITFEPSSENLSRFGLAVTLGGAEVKMTEMAAAYSAFANGGQKISLQPILKVEDRNDRVLEEYKPMTLPQVMSPQEAFIISNILSDNQARSVTFGSVNGLIVGGYQVAVKTGTTNDKRDNWTIGWTPNLLSLVWVGNNDNSPMGRVASGVSGATPIWRRLMVEFVKSRDKQDFPIPSGIVSVEVDKLSGFRSHDGFASRTEYFIQGTEPTLDDPIHLRLKVCKDSFGLATPQDVSSGNYDEKEYIKLREEDVVSTDGKNRWQEGIDWWIGTQENKDIYNVPDSYCRQDGGVGVRFASPGNESTAGNDFDVKIETESLKKIVKVELWTDGKLEKKWDERPFEIKLHLEDGTYKLKVRAEDKDGESAESEIKIGVNLPWDWQPSPTPSPTQAVTPTVKPTKILSPTPIETEGVGES